MPANIKPRLGIDWRRTKRETIGIIALSAILLAGYVWFLDRQEARAAQYFQDLRSTAPDQYLNEVRQVSGFDFFLSEYADLKGYGTDQSAAPDFMLGRWSLSFQKKRVSDTYRAAECVDVLLIENGRVTYPGQTEPTKATYRLADNHLFIGHGSGTALVTLIGSGIHLHHIELVQPGSDGPAYGYPCR